MAAGDLNVGGAVDVAGVVSVDGDMALAGDLVREGWESSTRGNVVIASGVVVPPGPFFRIDTEGAAASDDLTSFDCTGMPNGAQFIFQTTSNSRDVVIVHGSGEGLAGAGNIRVDGGANLTMDITRRLVMGTVVWAASSADAVVIVRRMASW